MQEGLTEQDGARADRIGGIDDGHVEPVVGPLDEPSAVAGRDPHPRIFERAGGDARKVRPAQTDHLGVDIDHGRPLHGMPQHLAQRAPVGTANIRTSRAAP